MEFLLAVIGIGAAGAAAGLLTARKFFKQKIHGTLCRGSLAFWHYVAADSARFGARPMPAELQPVPINRLRRRVPFVDWHWLRSSESDPRARLVSGAFPGSHCHSGEHCCEPLRLGPFPATAPACLCGVLTGFIPAVSAFAFVVPALR